MNEAQSKAVERAISYALADELAKVNRPMSKLSGLAARAAGTMHALEQQADELTKKLDRVEQRGGEAFAKWQAHIALQEQAIAEVENAVNQLSNGGPPLGNS